MICSGEWELLALECIVLGGPKQGREHKDQDPSLLDWKQQEKTIENVEV